MPTDLSQMQWVYQVDWLYVVVLAVFAFFASLIGGLLSFNRRGTGAFLSALLFAAMFVAWTYYPHGLPFPTRLTDQHAPAATAPAAASAPAAPVRPRNPVTDITPPKNPVTDVTPPKNPVTDVTPPANR